MTDPVHMFVYGTLQPGDVRWHFLEPFVVDAGWPDASSPPPIAASPPTSTSTATIWP